MRNNILSAGIILFILLLASCKKNAGNGGNTNPHNGKSNATALLSYSINGITAPVEISNTDHSVMVRFPDAQLTSTDIVSSFTLSKGATASIYGIQQVSGVSKNDYSDELSYLVTAEDGVTTQYWRIIGTNTNYSLPYGLGHFVKKAVSNNRHYDWYMGQSATGSFNTVNCGPTSVTMTIKWYDSNFTKTPYDARVTMQTGDYLWYPATISNYLRENNVPYTSIALSDTLSIATTRLKQLLDKGNVAIFMIISTALRLSVADTLHVDRYYSWDNGHCIVVKGYKDVDHGTFFEVYDPWDYESYPFGEGSKGKDRYYRAEDLIVAAAYNGDNCWSIPPK